MIWYFLITFIGMCIIGFFGYVGIFAFNDIFRYLFTHCSGLMWNIIFFIVGLIGAVIGFYIFWDGASKLQRKIRLRK